MLARTARELTQITLKCVVNFFQPSGFCPGRNIIDRSFSNSLFLSEFESRRTSFYHGGPIWQRGPCAFCERV